SNGASSSQTMWLCLLVLLASLPLLVNSIFRDAALMQGRYRKVQTADFVTSGVRLACVATALSRLTAPLGIAFAALANWVQWYFYRRRSAQDFDAAEPNIEFRKRVFGITKRMVPNVLFFCFQGQITFVLMTILGTTSGVADVAALGRLGALLA